MRSQSDFLRADYIGILRRVAIFLQRTGFTIHDLDKILANKYFDTVCYRPQNSESYQLSNINGYEFVGKKINIDNEEVEIAVDWDFFFKKMAVLVHRKNILGWSLSDVLLTFDLPLEKLDVICELIGRYGVSVQDALVLGGEQEASAEFINSVYQLPSLVGESIDSPSTRYRKVLKLLSLGLGLSEEDALTVYGMVNEGQTTPFLDILFDCYRYNLVAKTFGIALSNLNKILRYGVWAKDDRQSLDGIRKFSDEWRILSGTSIDVEFYLDLLAPISEDEKEAANKFALNLAASGLGEKPQLPEELEGIDFQEYLEEYNGSNEPEEAGEGENDGQNENVDAELLDKIKEYVSELNAWNENLKLLICAEFGIVDEHGDELLPDDLTEWETFYNEASDDNLTLSSASYVLYAKLLRKIAVYNFVQSSNQGIDLAAMNLLDDDLADSDKYSLIRPLVVAN